MTMTFQEIADLVRSKFPYEYTAKVRWSNVKYKNKVDIAEYAEDLLFDNGYKTNDLIKVFDLLNINAREGDRDNVLNTSLAKSLRYRRRNKSSVLPNTPKIQKQIPQVQDFLSTLSNSEQDKITWIKLSLTGPKNPKHRRRGGKFAGTDRRGIHKYMLLQRCGDHCAYCNSELDYGPKPKERGFDPANKEHTKHRPSLDRINPEIGYIDDNIQVICMHCNTLKGNATADEIMQLALAMQKQHEHLKTLNIFWKMHTIDIEKLNTDISDLEYKLQVLRAVKEYTVDSSSPELSTLENELSRFLKEHLVSSNKIEKTMKLLKNNDIRGASGKLAGKETNVLAQGRILMYKYRILKFDPSSDSAMKDALNKLRRDEQLVGAEDAWFRSRGW